MCRYSCQSIAGSNERTLGRRITYLVSKDHESVVGLASDDSAHTLGRVTHGIERQEVVLSDLELIPEVLQPGLKPNTKMQKIF